MTTTKFSEPARLSTPSKTIVLTKTAGQQPCSGHCCLRSSLEEQHLRDTVFRDTNDVEVGKKSKGTLRDSY